MIYFPGIPGLDFLTYYIYLFVPLDYRLYVTGILSFAHPHNPWVLAFSCHDSVFPGNHSPIHHHFPWQLLLVATTRYPSYEIVSWDQPASRHHKVSQQNPSAHQTISHSTFLHVQQNHRLIERRNALILKIDPTPIRVTFL